MPQTRVAEFPISNKQNRLATPPNLCGQSMQRCSGLSRRSQVMLHVAGSMLKLWVANSLHRAIRTTAWHGAFGEPPGLCKRLQAMQHTRWHRTSFKQSDRYT